MQSDDLGLARYGLVAHDDGSDRMEPVARGQWVRADEAAAAIERLVAERDEAREAWKQAFDLGVHHMNRAEAAEALLDFATFSPWLREWCKRHFGKWITHNTAKGALNELRARQALGDT